MPVLLFSLFISSDIIERSLVEGAAFPLLGASLVSGFFATVLMSFVLIITRLIFGIRLSIPQLLGARLKPFVPLLPQNSVGTIAHLVTGSMWGLIFGILVQNGFLFTGSITLSAVVYVLAPWLVMIFVTMPMMGAGFLGRRMHKNMWVLALVAHLAYGTFLGLILPVIFLL